MLINYIVSISLCLCDPDYYIVIFECLKMLLFLSNYNYVLQFSICGHFPKTCPNCLRDSCSCLGLRDEALHWELIHKWFSHVNKGLMQLYTNDTVFCSTITCYFLSFYCYLNRPLNWGLLRIIGAA